MTDNDRVQHSREFQNDLIARCLRTRRRDNDRPSGAWSTSERLFVALVLKNKTVLDEMGYTGQEAAQRLFGEPWSPDDPEEFVTWLDAIRNRVDAEPRVSRPATRVGDVIGAACQTPRPAWGTCMQAMAAGNILHTDLCPACTTTFMQALDAVTPGLEWHQNFRDRATRPVHPDAPGDH